MQKILFRLDAAQRRRLIKALIGLGACIMFCFFIVRFVPLSGKDDEAEFLRLVSREESLPESYKPKLMKVEGVEISKSCGEALELMLQDARQAGCDALLVEGYTDRKSQQQQYDKCIEELESQGKSREEATQLALKTMSKPGADEHQLGLSVDITDADYPDKSMAFLESKTYKWLAENCWNYGFIIRYPGDKTEITGRDFMPWHYRYVGVESAQLIKSLNMCLEEYYTWFYSDDVIIINN